MVGDQPDNTLLRPPGADDNDITAPVIPPDKAQDALDKIAKDLPDKATPASTKELSNWQKFLDNKYIHLRDQKAAPKDYLVFGANTIKAAAALIQQCLVNSCDDKTAVDAVGSMVLNLGILIGTVFP